MKMIEFVKEMFPWRLKWTWCGPWGWLQLPNGNVAKVTLSSVAGKASASIIELSGLEYEVFFVEITNPTSGPIVKSSFWFRDFLNAREDTGNLAVLERQGGEVEWKEGRTPISCHPIVNSIEDYVCIFDEYTHFLNGGD